MPYAYYNRLSARQKAVYRKSDEITSIRLPAGAGLVELAARVESALDRADPYAVELACRRLVEKMMRVLNAPPVVVRVRDQRPHTDWEELHGFYEPANDGHVASISVWMRTARRGQVVAYKTFLRTLLHEVCHHLDYERFELAESFHTQGFYKRETSLFRQLVPRSRGASAAAVTSAEGGQTRGAQALAEARRLLGRDT